MKPFKIVIKGLDTFLSCIEAPSNITLSDVIVKNYVYTDVIGKSVAVTNKCQTDILLPAKVVFTQSDGLGSTFKGSIKATNIPANSTVNIPIYYNGIYKGNNNYPTYLFYINGYLITYNMTLDTVGEIFDFYIEKDNRINTVFAASDFINHYTDINGDTITHIAFFNDVSRIRYQGLPYVANTWIPIQDLVSNNLLIFLAPPIDTEEINTLSYRVKDNKNNIIE